MSGPSDPPRAPFIPLALTAVCAWLQPIPGLQRRLALLALGWLLLFGALPLGAQQGVVLAVSVTDRLNGQPVVGAVVTLTPVDEDGAPLGAGRVYGTDQEGRFRTIPLNPGLYVLDTRAPGYQALVQTLQVSGPSPVTLTVQLAPDVMEVEGVAVLGTRNPFLEEAGFYERQRQGFGLSFTREDLVLLGVYQTSDVFRTVSGTALDYAGSPTSPFVRFRQGCRPDVVLDGANLGPDVRIDDLVIPTDIEGLEVFRGGGTVPSTLSNSPCGAVLIWTLSRNPEGADPFNWNRLIFGAVILALAQLIRP